MIFNTFVWMQLFGQINSRRLTGSFHVVSFSLFFFLFGNVFLRDPLAVFKKKI
jgi:hypothetical protein